MMRTLSSVSRLARTLIRDEAGNATAEFVILFPALMYIFFTLGEIGVLMTRSVMLDRGVGIVMRDLRIGMMENPTHEKVKNAICENAYLLSSCRATVMLEMTPLDDLKDAPPGDVRCVNRASDIEPEYKFDAGERSEIIFVRACIVARPLFPGAGLGALLPVNEAGDYALISESAFVNEPG